MTKFFTPLLWSLLCLCLPGQAQTSHPTPPIVSRSGAPLAGRWLGGDTFEALFPQASQAFHTDALRSRTGSTSLRLAARGGVFHLSSLAIPVQKGEEISLEVHAHYAKVANSRRLSKLATSLALAGVASMVGSLAAGGTEGKVAKRALPLLSLGAALPAAGLLFGKGVPRAYLQYTLYDKEGHLVSRAAKPLSKQARDGWQPLSLRTQALQDGYLQVSLVNKSQQAVYFDDGVVSHAGPSTAKFRTAGPVSKPDSLPPGVGSTPTAATS